MRASACGAVALVKHTQILDRWLPSLLGEGLEEKVDKHARLHADNTKFHAAPYIPVRNSAKIYIKRAHFPWVSQG